MKEWFRGRVRKALENELGFQVSEDEITNATEEIIRQITEPKDYTGTSEPSLKLEDSNEHTFGLVVDIEGYLGDEESGSIVGMWSKSPVDGCFHLWLMKAVDAMVDERIQWWAQRISGMRGREPKYSNFDKTRAIKEGPISAPKLPKAVKQEIALDEETGQLKMM